MKILLLTQYWDNYRELGAITDARREAYVQYMRSTGRDYHRRTVVGDYRPELNLPAGFQRIQLIRDILDEPGAPDMVAWQGSDTVILNPNWRVEDFTEGRYERGRSMYLTLDVHGINGDSFLIRNTQWSRDWLDFILSKVPTYRFAVWSEQKVMMDYWQEERWLHQILPLPQGKINSYRYDMYPPWTEHTPGHVQKGDWLLHLPGMNIQQRLSIIRSEWCANMMVPFENKS